MTKSVKTFIFAIIIVFLVYLLYSVYFTAKEGTESFDKFDVNSTANKNIKVELVPEKGFIPTQDGGVTFFVKDKNGLEKKVILGMEIAPEIKESKTVTLTGHMHGDYFHATNAVKD